MRNLKRALSLLLSSTMVLGMLVMGGSAAGYQDVDDSNKNQEAIEVLQAVGIMTGDQNGNFNPDGSITRNEMAVIMAHLLNLDYDYYRGTNPFTDVPDWAAPYVAACAAEGVVAGIGNGQFGGDQKVTAAQASLMIMKALGYFENAEDFGSDWQVATIRQASYINLFDQINASAESALTRGQVAQLVLNGLQAKTVYFTGDKGIQIGDVTVGYRAEYTPKTGTDKKYNTLVSGKTDISEQGQYYIQLGEELYEGQLRKAPDADEFDRPAFTWSYKAQKIGTYVDWSLLVQEYTTAVTGEDLYNVLTSSAIKAYDFAYYVDGKTSDEIKTSNMIRTNDTEYDTTGNGVLTQVFVDNEEEEITITSINTFLAEATADYNAKKETLSIEVYQNEKYDINKTLSLNDFDIADYKDGDMLRVCVAETSKDKYEVITIADPEVLSDSTVTKFSNKNYLVTDGTQYDYAMKGDVKNDLNAYYGSLLDNTYNIYLDAYGYVLGTVKTSGELKYLFMTGYDKASSHLSVKTAPAAAIFLDGTMKEIQVNVNDTNVNIEAYQTAKKNVDGQGTNGNQFYKTLTNGDNQYNKWFTYTTDKDGVYTLTPVANWMEVKAPADPAAKGEVTKINPASVRLDRGVGTGYGTVAYGNDDSVYLTVDTGAVSDDQGNSGSDVAITKVNGTYTGVQSVDLALKNDTDNGLSNIDNANDNADNSPAIFAVYDDERYIIGAVVVGEDATSTKDYAYALKSAQNEYVDADGNYYWDFEAVVDGEIKTLTVKEKGTRVLRDRISNWIGLSTDSMLQVTYDKDGYVIDVKQCVDNVTNAATQTDSKVYSNTEYAAKTPRDDFKVYDIYLNGSNMQLTAVGKTLYVEGLTDRDIGLTIAEGAPVVLVQQDTAGRWVINEYTTIKQALDALEDANTGVNGVQFKGHVAAVLNSNTTAQYLVIKSETLVPVEDDDHTTPSTGTVANVGLTSVGGISLTDKNDKGLTGEGLNWALYMRGPKQDDFNVAIDGKDIAKEHTSVADFMKANEGSYYIVVDGVKSNTVTVVLP